MKKYEKHKCLFCFKTFQDTEEQEAEMYTSKVMGKTIYWCQDCDLYVEHYKNMSNKDKKKMLKEYEVIKNEGRNKTRVDNKS